MEFEVKKGYERENFNLLDGRRKFELGENDSTQHLTVEKWIGYWFDCWPGRLEHNFAINTSMSDHIRYAQSNCLT